MQAVRKISMRRDAWTTLFCLAVSYLAAAPLHAQDQEPPIIALKAARLFDGKSDELIQDAVVLINGQKIAAMPGDPTSDIKVTENVFFVMKEGRVVKSAP